MTTFFIKEAYIRKMQNGKYRIYSEGGKNLGTFDTRDAAEKHLKEIEHFKHKKESKLFRLRKLAKILRIEGEEALCDKVLLSIAEEKNSVNPRSDLSYSYILRKLRKGDENRLHKFMSEFKNSFDEAVSNGIEDPESVALMDAMMAIDYTEDEE